VPISARPTPASAITYVCTVLTEVNKAKTGQTAGHTHCMCLQPCCETYKLR
jgi:hypothetical protein